MTKYPWHIRAGSIFSQAVNTLLFNGHTDMSLSTRAYLSKGKSQFWRFVFNAAELLFGQGHCHASFCSDIEYANDILAGEA